MKDGKFGWGIIGTGMIAAHFRAGIEACKNAELVAVCNRTEEKGRRFAEASGGVKFYSDYEKLVEDPDIDIVGVTTPSGLHADNVIAAAQAGKHAFCEKPLDISREKMSAMIQACREANVKLGCVFQSRTKEDIRKIHSAIQRGELGKMVLGDAFLKTYRSQAYYNEAGWKGTLALDGGGALMNQGVHGVDLLLWLMNDDVESVFARADHKVRDIRSRRHGGRLSQIQKRRFRDHHRHHLLQPRRVLPHRTARQVWHHYHQRRADHPLGRHR